MKEVRQGRHKDLGRREKNGKQTDKLIHRTSIFNFSRFKARKSKTRGGRHLGRKSPPEGLKQSQNRNKNNNTNNQNQMTKEDQLHEMCVKWVGQQHPDIFVLDVQKCGVVDMMIVKAKGQYHGLFIAINTTQDKRTPAQTAFKIKVTDEGYLYALCCDLKQFKKVVKNYMSFKIQKGSKKFLDIVIIETLVCWEYKIAQNILYQKGRKQNLVMCRYTIYYLAEKHLHQTGIYSKLGRRYNQNHATILYGIQTLKNHIKYNDPYKQIIERCDNKVTSFI